MNDKEKEPDNLFESNIDPQKLFNEKEYNTIIVGNEGLSKQDVEKADMLAVLVSETSTREEKDQALLTLKEKQSAAFMIQAIGKTKNPAHKAVIIAACWETGLDFSAHFAFFAGLVANDDYACALEAYTVLEQTEGSVSNAQMEESLTLLKNAHTSTPLVKEAIDLIHHKLHTA